MFRVLRLFTALLRLITGLAACNKPEARTSEKTVQKTFASPAEAGAAFLEAAKSGDQGSLLAIFGPDAKGILFSGDAVKDKKLLKISSPDMTRCIAGAR